MDIPKFTDVNSALIFLGSKIDKAKTHWEKYASASSAAYGSAWHHQEGILKQVEEKIKARMEASEKLMVFALNLLTVGVGGAVVGACVKKVLDPKTEEEIVKKTVEWARGKVEEPIKSGTEWAYKHFGSGSFEEAFKPPGITPDVYGPRLSDSIMGRAEVLVDMRDELLSDQSRVTLPGVQKLTQVICNMDFVEKLPPKVTEDFLMPKALLALWLTWAWQRDVGYWAVHSTQDLRFIAEQLDFELIRQDLIRSCGIPEALISQRAQLPSQFTQASAWTYAAYKNNDVVIDMDALIKWSKSIEALHMLYKGYEPPADIKRQMEIQWMVRRAMPWYVPVEA
jgi:hypothetical protein